MTHQFVWVPPDQKGIARNSEQIFLGAALVQLFLGAGFREDEVAHACDTDVDFK
jgi:hypothetical protein